MIKAAPIVCDYCGKPEPELPDGKKLGRCARCTTEKYCNSDCQRSDWKVHKKRCYTPAQMEERRKNGKTPAQYTTKWDPVQRKFVSEAEMAPLETAPNAEPLVGKF